MTGRLAAGGSLADMGTYVIDLRGHLGERLYIKLCDETPENTNGEDAEEPSADVDNTVTGPAPDDPIAEPTPNDPDPAMPVDEEDDPALKDDDDPDGEGSTIQEEKPESEEEPNAESQNGEP